LAENLSERFRSLLPSSVVVVETFAVGDVATLYPEEMQFVRQAVPKRSMEFAAGRSCARRALAEFGLSNVAILAAPDRQPIWPAGFVGSISHAEGYCAAAVARSEQLLSVGIDAERIGEVSRDIWNTICSLREMTSLMALPMRDRTAAVALLFSAKEAFYKFQYPITSEWLDFHDVNIEPLPWRPEGQFEVRPERGLTISAHIEWPIIGRYSFHDSLVTTAIAVSPLRSSERVVLLRPVERNSHHPVDPCKIIPSSVHLNLITTGASSCISECASIDTILAPFAFLWHSPAWLESERSEMGPRLSRFIGTVHWRAGRRRVWRAFDLPREPSGNALWQLLGAGSQAKRTKRSLET
jgi:4'-phosphopantetheinyl transferase EntD